jgi:hypothetical protein
MNIRNLKVAVRLFLRYGTVAVIFDGALGTTGPAQLVYMTRLSEKIANRKEAP